MTTISLAYLSYIHNPSFLMNIIATNLCSLKKRQTQLLTFKQDITTIKKCLEAAAVSNPLTIEWPDFPGEKNEEEERQKRRIEKEQIRQEINRREEESKEGKDKNKEYKDNKIGIEQPMVEVDNVQEEYRQHEGEYFHIRRKNYLKLCNVDLEYPSIQQTVRQKGQITFSHDIHDELQYPILQ